MDRRGHGNCPAKQRLSQSGPCFHQAYRNDHLCRRKYTLGQCADCAGAEPFASATFQQEFGTPDATFTTPTIFVPEEITGDLNGDGTPDLLVYSFASPTQTLSAQAFISNGKGGYTPAALQTFSIVSPGLPYPAVTNVPVLIDLNGDGKLDLLYGIQVAYGNGDGTFAAPVSVSFLASGFVATYAADLNGDGKTDILAVNATSWPALQFSVTVFLNGRGGSFTSAGTVPVGSGGMENIFVYQPTFIDLNGDGKLDLISQWNVVFAGAPQVSVLLNNGNGTFAIPTLLNVPYPPNIGESNTSYQTGYGDVKGDGKQDLILALSDHGGNSDAIILLGNGDGTFESPMFFASPTAPNVIIPILANFIVQDVNLDGKLDLVFGSGSLALGNGDGIFTLGTPLFPVARISLFLSPAADRAHRQSGTIACLLDSTGHTTAGGCLYAADEQLRLPVAYNAGRWNTYHQRALLRRRKLFC